MRHKRYKDLLTGLLFIALGIVALLVLIPRGIVVPQSVDIPALSPDFWPKGIAISVVVSALFLILESLFLKAPQDTVDPDDAKADAEYQLNTLPAALRTTILVFGLFIFFFGINTLGIVVSSIVLMICLMLFFGEKRWLLILTLSIVIPVTLYLFFLHVAGIPMPLGRFEALVN